VTSPVVTSPVVTGRAARRAGQSEHADLTALTSSGRART
jgi:hypothetical protein